ncbi:MAG: metallophosphoesterase [Clostridia bacterium]|nr:metallophosphoesterase [Clostridia bacterium]
MTIEKTTVRIPGLTKRYTFCHISDVHVAYARPDEPKEAREMAEKHAQRWSPNGILPVDALDAALNHADRIHADGVFLCGDCADYLSDGTAAYLHDRIARTETEVFFVCGNHEGGDYYKKVEDLRVCYPVYADLMYGSPAFWVRDMGEFLIIGMDDSDKNIRREQISALEEQLERGKPIVLLIHIPVYTAAIDPPVRTQWGPGGCDYFTLGLPHDPPLSREFCKLLSQKDNNIAAIFAGHIHLAHEGEFAPGKMQYTSAPTFTGYLREVTLEG